MNKTEEDKQSNLQEGNFEIQNQSIDRGRVDESGERIPDGIQQDNEYFWRGWRKTESGINERTGLS